MRFFFFVFYFSLGFCAYADTYPASPAGGGYFQIYAESDYVFALDDNDFDVNLQKKGFTIEMWIYLTRPQKLLDKAAAQGTERWTIIKKKDSYGLQLTPLSARLQFTFTHPRAQDIFLGPDRQIREKRWHYIAIMLSNAYVQQVVDTRLWGRKVRDLGVRDIRDLLAFRTSDSPLQIGGGGPSLIGILEGPLKGKPVLSNFTGGLIDEVRISNIIRYPWAQLDKEFWEDTIQMPAGPFEPDEHTVALWHFDFDGSGGSRWRDASGNGHHLTYHGDYLGIEPAEKLAVTWAELKRE
ncbi:LamG domain-containing protein [Candidatus Poribacteria bacterium]|nr:LamG domain-containing protein [Candidatus Poribacteria bacterium]MYC24444.1 LamG domain-containing protein [Gammaproteobacteria bacterium]